VNRCEASIETPFGMRDCGEDAGKAYSVRGSLSNNWQQFVVCPAHEAEMLADLRSIFVVTKLYGLGHSDLRRRAERESDALDDDEFRARRLSQ